MNLFVPPLAQIIFAILWGWVGLFISIVIFYVSYKLWKHYFKVEGTLTFNPKIKWNGKR